MSGGVDSSVAAAKLLESGFKVVGVTMKLWDNPPEVNYPARGCCSQQDVDDAKSVAEKLGFQHKTLNLGADFERNIIDDFIQEYRAGRTPNPCVRCNALIKWGFLWDMMRELSLNFIATGHYARTMRTDDGAGLFRSTNRLKDQSYALWGIHREKLEQTIFPLWEMSKDDVRAEAVKLGLQTAFRAESQEICFIPDDNYRKFLVNAGVNAGEGNILDLDGKVVGTHKGYIHYTIGQRKGLGGGWRQPMYVKRIDSEENRIYIAPKEEMSSHNIEVDKVNWLVHPIPQIEFRAVVKIRYRDPGGEAIVTPEGDCRMTIHFPQGVEAPTPGQSAVVYQGDRILGGGVIERIIE